jgi:hypothetical protein
LFHFIDGIFRIDSIDVEDLSDKSFHLYKHGLIIQEEIKKREKKKEIKERTKERSSEEKEGRKEGRVDGLKKNKKKNNKKKSCFEFVCLFVLFSLFVGIMGAKITKSWIVSPSFLPSL